MGGHFNDLLDWKFNPERSRKERSFKKNEQWRKIFDKEYLNYELFGDESEIVNIMIPPRSPRYTREIYNVLNQHITLIGGEFGATFRESREGLSTILNSYGYDYRVLKPIVDDFEYRLIKQFNDENKSKSNK